MSQGARAAEIPDRVYHWVPGELVVVVRLPYFMVDEAMVKLVEQVRSQLNVLLVQYDITLESYGNLGHGRTTAPLQRQAFLFALQRRQPLVAIFFQTHHRDPKITDAVPMALLYIQSHLEALTQVGLQIISAMPNWLITAAPYFYGDGGPAYPVQQSPLPNVAAAAHSLLGWRFQVLENIALDPRGAEDVHVAILDTAVRAETIRAAATQPEFRQHWLLQRLAQDIRNADGSFVVEYDRYPLNNNVRTGRDVTNEPLVYAMPDHGLALVGIVRDIAPRAKIRLVRILNDYGGGDLYPLFAALSDLEREYVGGNIKRLVINLSLTIMPDIRRLPAIWFDQHNLTTAQLNGAIRLLKYLEEGLRLLFDAMQSHGILVVAAAGNDSLAASEKGLGPRPPRAPARYESTMGVSAVNSHQEPASFANAANLPPIETGVATFGGDFRIQEDHIYLEAVKGLYLSATYPDGELNQHGWGNWAGTSFSAAIISALGAHMLGQGLTLNNAISRLSLGANYEKASRMYYGASPELKELLANQIRVQQRFGV